MLIDVQDLALSIGAVPILHGVNLSMGPGDIYGLLGPNGAGKSTTLSVLTGLRHADSGFVRILDLDPARQAKDLRRRLGVLSEDAGFYKWMTALDYLQFIGGLYGLLLSSQDIRARLAQVGLGDVGNHPVSGFSRGMKQRLGLARALLHQPSILVLDEPTNGLDPRGRREIHDLLIDLNRHHGVGILLCTHLLDDVDRLCNRIGIIANGRTLAEGTLTGLLATQPDAGHYRIRLRSQPPSPVVVPTDTRFIALEGSWMHLALLPEADPSTVWAGLLAQGWDFTEIHSESGGLENLYLQLTEKESAT